MIHMLCIIHDYMYIYMYIHIYIYIHIYMIHICTYTLTGQQSYTDLIEHSFINTRPTTTHDNLEHTVPEKTTARTFSFRHTSAWT